MSVHARLAAAVTAVALLLSGCAAQDQPSPYATATAADLQQTVLTVTEAAGDGDFPAARTRLEELEVATKVAHARGELSEARHDSILAAIALVRSDLEALIAEEKAKAEAAKQQAEEQARKEAEEQARKEAEARAAEEARQAAAAEAERQAAEQAAQQEAAQNDGDDDGDGDDGKGKGKGKNKGKGNGKDG
jgi:membrane protein involved in colicin uptake